VTRPRPARQTPTPAAAGTPHAAALAYAARGWSALPIEPGGKRPLLPWRALQERRAGAEQIGQWFERWPDANVGIVTGHLSGLVVVDVDAAHGGPASLARVEAGHGPLPPTPEVLTGGGGRHLYFAHPGHPVGNRVGLFEGIDVRGDGGCVVAPPSRHPSGRHYAWAAGRSPDEQPLAPLPPVFGGHPDGAPRLGHSLAHWRQLVREGVDAGRRNTTLASLTGHLLWHGVDPAVALELMLAWNRARCRPPLGDDEVLRVVDSITRLHDKEVG
jgi:hypothetical protein